MTTGQDEKTTAWETESGLPSDVDAWIANPSFGTKEEYSSKVAETSQEPAILFLFDMVDENGEVIGSQGYSIGSGWTVEKEGASISHPKRNNVVGSTNYGRLINRAVKELGVDMDKFGLPTDAKSWAGLGFHWMIEDHPTVGGGTAQGIMPTEFLGEKKEAAKGKPPKAPPASDLEKTLVELMAEHTDVKAFQLAAIKVAGVATDDTMMASVLDEGDSGFWATHQK